MSDHINNSTLINTTSTGATVDVDTPARGVTLGAIIRGFGLSRLFCVVEASAPVSDVQL
ncbi:MAG: hypothetical protein WC556_05925 [Candidatus Methanoperedens sp.]